jgi:hypothetical protein
MFAAIFRRMYAWMRWEGLITGLWVLALWPAVAVHGQATENRYRSITTRVLVQGAGNHAIDYGVRIGRGDNNLSGNPEIIQAPAFQTSGNNAGFQVVTIGRGSIGSANADSNVSYPTDNPLNLQLFEIGLQEQLSNHCSGENGCVVVIQSLSSIGYTGCNFAFAGIPNATACASFQNLMDTLGIVSPVAIANGSSAQVGFSYIGNCVGGNCNSAPVTGAFYEKMSCNGTNAGACLANSPSFAGIDISGSAPAGSTRDQLGKIEGALVRTNNELYTYTPTTQRISFSVIAGSNNSNNIILVTPGDPTMLGGKTVWWSPQEPANVTWQKESALLPSGSPGGFRLLAIDASPFSGAPTVLLDKVYSFTGPPGSLVGPSLRDLAGHLPRLESQPDFSFHAGDYYAAAQEHPGPR